MPFPNFHACRLRNPDDFQSDSMRTMHRKHEGKDYSVIMGRLMGEDAMTEQAYRYAKSAWTASDARSHCKEHDGSFEAAAESDNLKGFEVRSFDVEEFRIVEEEGLGPRIRGHAAVFNLPSEPIGFGGGFVEIIKKGAFAKTLGEADVRALWNHDPNYVLGRNKSGTLNLTEDKRGLAVEIQPPETQWARDLLTSMQRGDVNQMSFGFQVVKDTWVDNIRTLHEVKLFDVSVVTFPAYPQTDAAVRAAINALQLYLPPEPPQEEHSEEEPLTHSKLAIAKRRLRLMELRR